MKKEIKTILCSSETYYFLMVGCLWTGHALYIGEKWYVYTVLALFFAIAWLFLLSREISRINKVNFLTSLKLQWKFFWMFRKAMHSRESTDIYRILDEEILPEMRKILPRRIYKYYSLTDNEELNKSKFDSLRDNKIWGSVYSEFNDPYETRYIYLNKEDFDEMGFPENSAEIWRMLTDGLRERITTVCFSQNPDDMPMWAYYANSHHGFCVEYEINHTDNLYPVIYVDERMKSQMLCIDLIYELLNPELHGIDKVRTMKHFILLTAFKHKSWKAENEIRAIFMNHLEEIHSNGKLHSCAEIGVHPTRIFSGVNCAEKHIKLLSKIADEIEVQFVKCELSMNKRYTVMLEEPHA